MPKISIVLSAILVVLGISAGNADSYPPVSRDKCIQSIHQVHGYINNTLADTPDSKRKNEIQLRADSFFKAIKKIEIPEEMPGISVLTHDMRIPDGEHIDCEIDVALMLSDQLDAVDRLHKKSTE